MEQNAQMRLVLLEGKNEELEAQVKQQEATIDGQRDRIEELASEKEQLNKRIKAKDDRIQELMQQKEALEKEKNAAIYEKEKSNKQASEKLNSALTARSDRLKLSVFVTAFLSLLIGATIAFSTAFTLEKWWQWQFIVGAFGGVVLCGMTFFLLVFFDSDRLLDVGCQVFGALFLINTILTLVFNTNYYIISFWMSGCLIVANLISMYRAIDETEGGIAAVFLVEEVLSIVSIILTAIFARKMAGIEWWQLQHVIGALGGGVLFLYCFFLLPIFYEKGLEIGGCLAFGVLLALNTVLTPIFKANYQILSFWVSGCLIAASALAAYVSFDDEEPLFGGILVGEGVLSIVSIILTAVLI